MTLENEREKQRKINETRKKNKWNKVILVESKREFFLELLVTFRDLRYVANFLFRNIKLKLDRGQRRSLSMISELLLFSFVSLFYNEKFILVTLVHC